MAPDSEATTKTSELNFIKRPRLTNTLIKSILGKNAVKPTDQDLATNPASSLSTTLFKSVKDKISKKNKTKLKKQFWHDSMLLFHLYEVFINVHF